MELCITNNIYWIGNIVYIVSQTEYYNKTINNIMIDKDTDHMYNIILSIFFGLIILLVIHHYFGNPKIILDGKKEGMSEIMPKRIGGSCNYCNQCHQKN